MDFCLVEETAVKTTDSGIVSSIQDTTHELPRQSEARSSSYGKDRERERDRDRDRDRERDRDRDKDRDRSSSRSDSHVSILYIFYLI